VIRGLLNVLQFLFWLFVLRLVVRTVAGAFSSAPPRARATGAPPRAQVRAPEDLVLDRVCRTYVPRSRSVTARVSGREEHFCSIDCRDKAQAAVARAS
jgi:hypothetical protein